MLPTVSAFNAEIGKDISNLAIGLVPPPGKISGVAFEDTIPNNSLDTGESLVPNLTVFLDDNQNGALDGGEQFTVTDANGAYLFDNLLSQQIYRVALSSPGGFSIVLPENANESSWDVFVGATGIAEERNFGIRQFSGFGQSSSSNVSGILFHDNNANGTYDHGIDFTLAGTSVFFDSTGDREHTAGADEPIVTTRADGTFEFSGQPSRIVTVRPELDENWVLENPIGNRFDTERYDLFSDVTAFTTISEAKHADFNGDGAPDLIVSLSEGNALAIRMNDEQGGFGGVAVDVALGETETLAGTSLPIAIETGQFNADPRIDVAVAGQTGGNVLVLLDYNKDTGAFLSRQSMDVGDNPVDLVAADFDQDGFTDLTVLHLGTSEFTGSGYVKLGESFQVLLGNGDGTFDAQAEVAVSGDDPTAIAAADFTGDGILDLAILHRTPTLTGTPFGDVALYTGDGSGQFTETDRGLVEGGPLEMVSGDFTGDGIADVAVANVLQRTISVLASNGDGTWRKAEKHSIGTGVKGIDSMGVADIDNDGDLDIVGTRFQDGGVAVFRNITDVTADPVMVEFEPLESFGVAAGSVFDRAPIVLANFDGDTSGANGEGTIDVVAIPKSTGQINVLLNELVDGGHRIALDGTNQFTQLNFIVKPAVIPPTLDPVSGPVVMDEDETYTVNLSGISIGRQDSADFKITVFSSHPEIIPDQVVRLAPGQSEASFVLSPRLDANTGMTPNETPITVTVEARNAGPGVAAVFGDGDDGVTTRSFTVTINPVNDPPIFSLPTELPPVSQKALPQSIAGFVTGIAPGGGDDEDGQALFPFVVATDSSFFDVPPAIDSAGQLTFTPSDRRSGPVSVAVSLSDTGGTENGGANTTVKTFVINILPVNDPPTFNLLESQVSVRADAGAQSRPGFAYGFDSGGGPDEDSQGISDYLVLAETPGLFEVLPQIDRDGVLTFTPAADRRGTTDVTVRVRDSGGTDNLGTDLSDAITFQITIEPVPDAISPTPLLTSSTPEITNQQAFDVVVSFGEPVMSFSASDVTVVGGSARTPIDLGGGNYIVPIDADPGTVQVSIESAAVDDLAGNPNLASATFTRTINTAALVPFLSSASNRTTNAETILVNVDFAREVSGFDLADVVVDGATTGNLTAVDASSGRYQFELSVDADGDVTVSIPAGAATDAAGNRNVASNLLERTVERIAPHPVLSVDVDSPTSEANFFVDIDFGEPVEGFELDDLMVTNAAAAQFQSIAPGRYSVLLSSIDGTVTIGIDAAVTRDLAGNDNAAATPVSVIVDTIGVTPTLTSNAPGLSNLNAIPISIDFGEQVVGFDVSDVLVVNGAVAGLSSIDTDSGRYQAIISPSADGMVSVIIPSGAATDVAGNTTGASDPLTRTIDRVLPEPTFRVRGASSTALTTMEIEVEFSEPVVGFEATDLVLTSGTVQQVIENTGGQGYVVFVAGITDGAFTASLPDGVVSDAAGNPSTAASSNAVSVDSGRPTPTLSAIETATAGVFSLTISFDENVQGLSERDFVLSGTALTDLSGSGRDYTGTVTVSGSGDAWIQLPEDTVGDAFGNRNVDSNLLILSKSPESIVLTSSGEAVDMTTLADSLLSSVVMIDIRGTGGNSLMVDASKIQSRTPGQSLLVISDTNDTLTFDDGWEYATVTTVDDQFERHFNHGDATLRLVGPLSWTNPLDPFDINHDARISATDALVAINAIGRGTVVDSQGTLVDPRSVDPSLFRFYDVNRDQKLTALDALQVINRIAIQAHEGEGELSAPNLVRVTLEGHTTGVVEETLDGMPLQSTRLESKRIRWTTDDRHVFGTESTKIVGAEQVLSSKSGARDKVLEATWNWVSG